MAAITQEFTLYTPDKNGYLTVDKEYNNGSWTWKLISFKDFIIGKTIVQGLANRHNGKWNISFPFKIIRNGQEILFNPTSSDLEKLCELAVSDFFTFETELFRIANVEGGIGLPDFEVELTTTFIREFTEILVREVGRNHEEGTTIYYRVLEFHYVPIGGEDEWFICGELLQRSEEEVWYVKNAHLHLWREIFLTKIDSVIEEEIPLTEKVLKPLKKEFISLYEAMKNENFELVEDILENIECIPLPKISKRVKSHLAYYTRDWTFRAFVDGDSWSFGIEDLIKEGSDKKIAATLRKLIRLTMETNDDVKLRRFCNKIINQENSKTNY